MKYKNIKKVIVTMLAVVIATSQVFVSMPISASEAETSLGPVTSKDVIYQIITDRFYDGDTTNNIPSGFDA